MYVIKYARHQGRAGEGLPASIGGACIIPLKEARRTSILGLMRLAARPARPFPSASRL